MGHAAVGSPVEATGSYVAAFEAAVESVVREGVDVSDREGFRKWMKEDNALILGGIDDIKFGVVQLGEMAGKTHDAVVRTHDAVEKVTGLVEGAIEDSKDSV